VHNCRTKLRSGISADAFRSCMAVGERYRPGQREWSRSEIREFTLSLAGQLQGRPPTAGQDFLERAAIREFVGLVTRDKEGVDVMEGGFRDQKYQISQGQIGNFTRFINHSCNPSAQFARFVKFIIAVSRGIKAGKEITVDYSRGELLFTSSFLDA